MRNRPEGGTDSKNWHYVIKDITCSVSHAARAQRIWGSRDHELGSLRSMDRSQCRISVIENNCEQWIYFLPNLNKYTIVKLYVVLLRICSS